jgi:deazaflavin-dependent oxidoreductase (nitroreductase family)
MASTRRAPPTRHLLPFTTHVVNPITRLFAGWLPWFAIVIHVGRRTGQRRRTPVNVFRDGELFVFALTYGSNVQWVKNVLAAGSCELRTRGRTVRVTDPRVFVDERRRLMPLPVRFFLGLIRVTEFMSVRPLEPPERRPRRTP